MNLNELNATARELLELRAMIEELNAQAESLTDRIKAAMVAAGQETLTGDGWKASWKNVNGIRFDSKHFKAEQADLYQQYRKATTAPALF